MRYFILLLLLNFINFSQSQFHREKILGDSPVDLSDSHLQTPELLKKHGLDCETHQVVTGDGYILTLHRVPAKKDSPVLILFPGGLATSREWFLPISGSINDSFGYLAAKMSGYDLWMFNTRGTSYSAKHVDLKSTSPKFWDFSIDEQALYDFPATLDYILKSTNQSQVSCLGMSLGGMISYRSLAIHPTYNEKIKIFIGWATNGGYLGNMTSDLVRIFTTLANPEEPFKSLFYLLSPRGQLIPKYMRQVLEIIYFRFCKFNFASFCDALTYSLAGKSPKIWVDETVEWTILKFPDSISIKTVVHLAQGVREVEGRPSSYYDYGLEKNMQIYGTSINPIYNMSKVTTPCAFFSGISDGLVSSKDVDYFITFLPNVVQHHVVSHEGGFSHGDFIISQLARKLVYEPTLELLKSYN